MFGWGKKDKQEKASHSAVDLAQLIETAGDAVIVCDAAGAITLWNPAAERIFGYTAAEATGKSLDIIIPERLRSRHWDGHHAAMERGWTKYGNDLLKVPAVTKDGRALSIAFTVGMLKDDSGAITGVSAIIRDETARFQEDRELRKQLAELKAKAGP